MPVKMFTFNDFQENTFVIYSNGEAIIVDPGCAYPHEEQTLKKFIEENGLHVKAIVNTHCHLDHVVGNPWAVETFNVPLFIHEQDLFLLKAAPQVGMMWSFPVPEQPKPDVFLDEGDVIKVGNEIWRVIHVPGHSPGHIALYNPETKQIISGDVIFAGSIGRTDLPGGDYTTLMNSVIKILNLGEDITIFPGHGPTTTTTAERQANPFVIDWLQSRY